jgi:TolB-like protein|tara:strand:- start:24 stop:983 length:960 start_codon:yes stop_codon:yes gene_type:complete
VERPFPAYKGDDPYIFICYAHADAEVVYPEITRLRDEGLNIWYDEGISPGVTWRDEVAEALARCQLLLFFVTPQSVASANCQKEVNYALSRNHRILTVHLQRTTLSPGLELSLSDMQAVVKEDHTQTDYERKLKDGLQSLLSDVSSHESLVPDAPHVQQTKEPELTAIAVLPMVNSSNDADNEFLCDGISGELINGLSQVKGLKVASQLSAFTFKSEAVDIKTVGAVLSVGSVLSGSVQKSGNTLRISVRLDQVKDGTTLWSHHYDREMKDIFALQDDLAREVIEVLRIELAPDHPSQLIDAGTSSSDAYHAYLSSNIN